MRQAGLACPTENCGPAQRTFLMGILLLFGCRRIVGESPALRATIYIYLATTEHPAGVNWPGPVLLVEFTKNHKSK